MGSTLEVFIIDDVAATTRLAPVSIRKAVSDRRKGIGSFPLPISAPGGKLRWLASDIEAYLQSLSSTDPPVKTPSASKRRQESKSFKQRQELAQKALDRHRADRIAKARPPVKKYKLPEPLKAADK